MIYLLILISSLLHAHTTHCTSTFNTSAEDLKQPVNFSGKLTTHQGQEYNVNNISIEGKYKHIPMYDKPMQQPKQTESGIIGAIKEESLAIKQGRPVGIEEAETVDETEVIINPETKLPEIKLSHNPTTDLVKTKIDLDELSEISVPSPDTIWFYQKKERQQKLEFIEVDVTTKSNTKTAYLLERKTRINCDAIDAAGPQEKQVPLSAVKTLTIEGFSCRADTKRDKTPCPGEKK
jgi:hypothetical protein